MSIFAVLILNYTCSSRGELVLCLHSCGIYPALPFPPLFSSPPPAATFHRLNSIMQPSAELLPVRFTPQFCFAGHARLTRRKVSLVATPPPQTQKARGHLLPPLPAAGFTSERHATPLLQHKARLTSKSNAFPLLELLPTKNFPYPARRPFRSDGLGTDLFLFFSSFQLK